jgi:hypothetical protein
MAIISKLTLLFCRIALWYFPFKFSQNQTFFRILKVKLKVCKVMTVKTFVHESESWVVRKIMVQRHNRDKVSSWINFIYMYRSWVKWREWGEIKCFQSKYRKFKIIDIISSPIYKNGRILNSSIGLAVPAMRKYEFWKTNEEMIWSDD